jgi:hypothetical protein
LSPASNALTHCAQQFLQNVQGCLWQFPYQTSNT